MMTARWQDSEGVELQRFISPIDLRNKVIGVKYINRTV